MNITLIGMPACGKSTLGKILAKNLEFDFVDTDNLIEQKYGRRLHEIISESGLENFKKIEEEVLLDISYDNTVIATGGSAIYYDEAMNHLKDISKVVYLRAKLNTIVTRLGDFSKRGIALKDGMTIADLYNERIPLYEKYADITVDCDNIGFKKNCVSTIEKIKSMI